MCCRGRKRARRQRQEGPQSVYVWSRDILQVKIVAFGCCKSKVRSVESVKQVDRAPLDADVDPITLMHSLEHVCSPVQKIIRACFLTSTDIRASMTCAATRNISLPDAVCCCRQLVSACADPKICGNYQHSLPTQPHRCTVASSVYKLYTPQLQCFERKTRFT